MEEDCINKNVDENLDINLNENKPGTLFPDFVDAEDFGRESLGIINLDNLNIGGGFLGFTDTNDDNEVFNTAFFACESKNSTRANNSSLDLCTTSTQQTDFINDEVLHNSDYLKQLHSCGNSSILALCIDFERNLSNFSRSSYDQINSFKEKKKIPSDNVKLGNYSFITSRGNEDFNESIFIEANHLASRIEDGSILELGTNENDMLDSIQEPEILKNLSSEDLDSNTKPTTEVIFKTVDKILPPTKDPKDILDTLSDILKNDHLLSEKQKTKGQHMISTLAEILTCKQGHFDDSGHSSIENDVPVTSPDHECYQVLDLRKKSCAESDDCFPLDLSSESSRRVFASPKIVPQKSQEKKLDENRVLNDFRSKFKLKRTDDKANARKGPMKAVVPIHNMARRNSDSSNSKLRKPSTPVKGLSLKPIAQSTPEGLSKVAVSSPKSARKSSYSGARLSKSEDLKISNQKRPVVRGNEKKLRSCSAGERVSSPTKNFRQVFNRNMNSDKRKSVLKENKNKVTSRSSSVARSSFGKENSY